MNKENNFKKEKAKMSKAEELRAKFEKLKKETDKTINEMKENRDNVMTSYDEVTKKLKESL